MIRPPLHVIFAAALLLIGADRAMAWRSEWNSVMQNMEGILRGAKIYRKTYGVYPATDDQSTWAAKLINDRIVTQEMIVDWSGRLSPGLDGTSFLYIPPADLRADPDDPDAQPLVRWFGYNGIDDGGAGDDITAGREINDGHYSKSGRPLARMLGAVFAIGLMFVIIPGVIWWKPMRRIRWTILPAYLSVAAIVICPLTITPWRALGHGPPKTIWKAAWATIGLLIAYWFVRSIAAEIGRTRAARRARKHCCVRCRYDLRGITAEVCPECGTPMVPSPAVPRSCDQHTAAASSASTP